MKRPIKSIEEVKASIAKLKGFEVTLKISLGRNRYVEVLGEVVSIYPAVFTVKAQNDIKTFPYSKVACGDVEFITV